MLDLANKEESSGNHNYPYWVPVLAETERVGNLKHTEAKAIGWVVITG
jgi:hypothetical protein